MKLYYYSPGGRLSHDHEIGRINAVRVLAHNYLSSAVA